MSTELLMLLFVCVIIIAFLYSSVGHAGASGYIAVMSLFGLTMTVIRPTALILNIFVAFITAFQFYKAKHFKWHVFWPFAVTAVPCAFAGGYIKIPDHFIKITLGCVLLFSAARLLFKINEGKSIKFPGIPISLLTGALLGFLAGITGTGGGIFLTPLLILLCWADTRTAAAVSSLFILVNSIAGLTGFIISGKSVPISMSILVVAAILGGSIGAYFGSRKFSAEIIKRVLSCVLVVAGIKLIFL